MRAIARRDSHPGEESDRHFGEHDILLVIDEAGSAAAKVHHVLKQGGVDNLAALMQAFGQFSIDFTR